MCSRERGRVHFRRTLSIHCEAEPEQLSRFLSTADREIVVAPVMHGKEESARTKGEKMKSGEEGRARTRALEAANESACVGKPESGEIGDTRGK